MLFPPKLVPQVAVVSCDATEQSNKKNCLATPAMIKDLVKFYKILYGESKFLV
jgi:hypothetical protein